MTEELARAWAFMRRADAAGDSEEPSPLGTAVRDSRVPLRQDSNFLFVERPAAAEEILAELRRLALPIATVAEESLLAGHAAGAEIPHRGVVMVHRGPVPPARRAAVEVGHEELAPLRHAFTLAQPWGSEQLADQLALAKSIVAERVPARFFASYEGDEVAAYADLYLDPPEAQIEDVGTTPRYRGRGHGTAVVLGSLAAARGAGAEFVFLVADAEDWPKDWYARLGFETVGRYLKLRPLSAAP